MAILGCTHVGNLYNQGTSTFQAGYEAIKDYGFGSIRLFAAPTYLTDYVDQDWDGATPTTLKELVQTTPFTDVLGDNTINRIWFTTFTFANGVGNDYLVRALPSELQDEYDEIYEFVCHLLATYPGKTFILNQGEPDFALISNYVASGPNQNQPPVYRAECMKAIFDRRQRAVRDAMRDTPSTAKVLHAVECNRNMDGGIRIVRDVIPRLFPDMVSYTPYEGINIWEGGQMGSGDTGNRNTVAMIDKNLRAFDRLLKQVAGPNTPLAISEFAVPENDFNFFAWQLDAKAFCKQVLDTCDALPRIKDVIFWTLWDNTFLAEDYRGYWFQTDTDQLSRQALAYAGRLDGVTEPKFSTYMEDTYVTLGNSLSLNLQANEFTVSLYFKITDLSVQRYIFARAEMGGLDINYILGASDTGQLFGYFGGTGSVIVGGVDQVVEGQWHHACFTVRDIAGTKTGSIWLDGVQQGGTVVPQTGLGIGAEAKIGSAGVAAANYAPFKGSIDEVSIFTGVGAGFTGAEVIEIRNGGTPLVSPSMHSKASKLAHWYTMGDADAWPIIHDNVGVLEATCVAMEKPRTNWTTDTPV